MQMERERCIFSKKLSRYIDPDIERQDCWDRGDGTYYNTATAYIIMEKLNE